MMAPRNPSLPPPFEDVMRRYEREIMRYVMRLSGDRDDAADLFQETWLRAYRAYPRVDAERDLRPWLYAIATNLCRNHFRDRGRLKRMILRDTGGAQESARPARHEGDGYARTHVRELIGRLPVKQRQAFLLRHVAGLEFLEIAAALGCSQESARANLSLAAKKLKAAW